MKNSFFLLIALIVTLTSCGEDDGGASVNLPPVIEDQSFNASENIDDATTIGTVQASDPEGETLSFSMTENSDDLFEITSSGTLTLTPGSALDFETTDSYSLTVTVSDGVESATATVTINVTDVDERVTPVITAQSFTVAENILDTDAIGTVTATDPNGDALTFSIIEDADNLFEITDAGVLSLQSGKGLDFETKTEHAVTVAVTDGMESVSATISITVTNFSDIPFVTTWTVDNASGLNILINTSLPDSDGVPVTGTTPPAFDYTIDWGDGNIETNLTGNATHTYAAPGTYTVKITGVFPYFHADGISDITEKLMTIEAWGDIEWYTLKRMFLFCDNLTYNATDTPDLSRVINMSAAFQQCTNFNGAIGNWDVSTIQDMSALFTRASLFNQDIGSWDVGNVTDFGSMFSNASAFNQDIGGWDVSSAADMSAMFASAGVFNQDIGNWNVSNVSTMEGMFNSASDFNQAIGSWDVTNVVDMSTMFSGAFDFNQDITRWNVRNVRSMFRMFFNAQRFNQGIGGWNVGNVLSMNSMFGSAFDFDQDLSGWDTANVTDCTNFASSSGLSASSFPRLGCFAELR